jgi:hypothetical protein
MNSTWEFISEARTLEYELFGHGTPCPKVVGSDPGPGHTAASSDEDVPSPIVATSTPELDDPDIPELTPEQPADFLGEVDSYPRVGYPNAQWPPTLEDILSGQVSANHPTLRYAITKVLRNHNSQCQICEQQPWKKDLPLAYAYQEDLCDVSSALGLQMATRMAKEVEEIWFGHRTPE